MQQAELTQDPPTKTMEEQKVFCDPVHGHIVLDRLLVKIIDTPQFQRLRNIKQLGGNYFVYPGASHNRFEHSLGVAHLAGKLVETLKTQQPELDIDDRDVLCVKVAGLCHDLGHGPFSHTWDGCVLPKRGKKWKHEEGSASMLEYLLKENSTIKEEYKNLGFSDANFKEDITFIKELITVGKEFTTTGAGGETEWKYKGREEKKRFLYEIISNKRNGIDVDKWDYFKRDCHHLGITCIFDIDRAMKFVRVIGFNGQKQICFRDKEARNIYQMFQTRELLHRMAYQHKTSKAVEMMLTEALYLADRSGEITIPGKEGGTKLSECHLPENFCAFTNLTDHVFQLILTSTSTHEDVKESKRFLERIQTRDIYRFIGEVPSEHADKVEEWVKENSHRELDLVTNEVKFDFGMGEENPFDNIGFYKKDQVDRADTKPLKEISTLLPKEFQEKVHRVYSRKSDSDKEEIERIRKDFDEWKKKLDSVSEQPKDCDKTPPHNGSNGRADKTGDSRACKRLSYQEDGTECGEPLTEEAKLNMD